MRAVQLLILATLPMSACLGPNPLLEDCGEKWVIEVDGAHYRRPHTDHWIQICADWQLGVGCIRPRAEICLNRDQAANLVEHPDGQVRQALEAKALAACKEIAIFKNAAEDTCAEYLTDPFYEGRCMLEADFCGDPYTSEHTETGGEDTETGEETEALDLEGISCDADVCTVPTAAIESILAANQVSLWADGTTFALHLDPAGLPIGWIVEGVEPDNLGGLLGFEPGDVITAIGDAPIDSWGAVVDAANAALAAGQINLAFEREGRSHERTYVRAP